MSDPVIAAADAIVAERERKMKSVTGQQWYVAMSAVEATNELTRLRVEMTEIRRLLSEFLARPSS